MPHRTLLAAVLTQVHDGLTAQAEAARAAGADIVELRVDLLGDLAAVEAYLGQPRPLPTILTVRSAEEGGAPGQDEHQRLGLLRHGVHLAPEYVDVELATWQRQPELSDLCAVAARPRLILSHHDWQATPTNLDDIFDRFETTPADVCKVVFAAHDATDALRVLDLLHRRGGERPTVALAMGAAGLGTRVLAPKFGGFLTFAALRPDDASAPGQLTLDALRRDFRWDELNPATRVYGVVGWPVEHSQSPLVHNAAMRHAAIDGVYVPWPVRPEYEAFADFMAVATDPALDIHGLSVTLPHKVHALRWLEERGDLVIQRALRCGAVNTITRRADGTWQGDNTDVSGALAALTAGLPAGSKLSGKRVAVLGAGGVARSVIVGLQAAGARPTVFNRTAARAEALAAEFNCAWQPWEERARREADIVVNCTSVGLWPAVDDAPLPAEALRSESVVFDTVYRPAQTRLLRDAAAAGCTTISGVSMFLGQAAEQFRQWHGPLDPLPAMRRALEQAEKPRGQAE